MMFKFANTDKTEDTHQAIKDSKETRFRCSCGKSGALIEFAFTLFPDKSEAACIYCGSIYRIKTENGKMELSRTGKTIDGSYMEDME